MASADLKSADIINAVLETDAKITAKLEAALRDKENVIAIAKAEGEEKIRSEVNAASERIEKISAEERRKADERIAETENKKTERLKELDRVFSEKHEEWEKNLFEAVTASAAKL